MYALFTTAVIFFLIAILLPLAAHWHNISDPANGWEDCHEFWNVSEPHDPSTMTDSGTGPFQGSANRYEKYLLPPGVTVEDYIKTLELENVMDMYNPHCWFGSEWHFHDADINKTYIVTVGSKVEQFYQSNPELDYGIQHVLKPISYISAGVGAVMWISAINSPEWESRKRGGKTSNELLGAMSVFVVVLLGLTLGGLATAYSSVDNGVFVAAIVFSGLIFVSGSAWFYQIKYAEPKAIRPATVMSSTGSRNQTEWATPQSRRLLQDLLEEIQKQERTSRLS